MRRLTALVTGFWLALSPLVISAATAKPVHKTSTSRKKAKSAAVPKKAMAANATAAKRRTSNVRTSSRRRSGKSARTRQTWRNRQTAPTPERYMEIQQALVDRGYGPGPASGTWGPEWVAALKKFQQEQNLEASGRIDALSLMSLGLGPKREAAPVVPKPVPSATPQGPAPIASATTRGSQ